MISGIGAREPAVGAKKKAPGEPGAFRCVSKPVRGPASDQNRWRIPTAIRFWLSISVVAVVAWAPE
jgi:hypothetical protein